MENLIPLDKNVLLALDFFIKDPPPSFNIKDFSLPFVVGSGNAYNTGLILFSEKAAIFADESNFKKILPAFDQAIKNKLITQAIIISASGGKDSVWEIEFAKEYGLQTTLLTTKSDSQAAKTADKTYTFKSINEPYTYNVSTYMGMILSSTRENPAEIKDFIAKLEFPQNFGDYDAYSFVVSDKYGNLCPMLDIKKSELFGPNLSLRAFPMGHARHAKFVIRSNKELVITINEDNKYFGDPNHRWNISVPDSFSYAAMMAITYFIIGKIQTLKPGYYKENISNYVNDYGPKAYGSDKPFDLIVPGTKE